MTTGVRMDPIQKRLAELDATISQLSGAELTLDAYFRDFLDQIVRLLGIGGGVWTVAGPGEMANLCHMNLSVAGLDEGGRQGMLNRQALGRVVDAGQPVVLPGNDSSNVFDGGMGGVVSNESPHTLMYVPISSAEKVDAVLVLISPEGVDPRAVRGYLGFILGLCGKAGEFLRRQKIDKLAGQLSRADRLRQYVSSLHSSLDPQRVCYSLANYGQELLGVYRCIAGSYSSRGKFHIEAVSGLEAVAVKSNMIRSVAEVARQVCRNDKPLLVDNPNAVKSALASGEGDDLIMAARIYMMEAGSLMLGIFPIRHEKQVVGALMVEKATEEPFDDAQRRQIDDMLVEAGTALHNGMTYRHLPLSPVMRAVGATRDKIFRMDRTRRLFWAALLLIVCLAPFVIPWPVKVVGKSELIPVEAHLAYARQQGVIDTVLVKENQSVKKGDILAVMDRRPVESELDRVNNAIAEADLLLSEENKNRSGSSEAARLRFRLNALQAERKKYELEKEQYAIVAPVDGKMITPEHTLRILPGKPTERGESVMEVVPEDTPWELMVYMPEDEAGDLLKAYDGIKDHQKDRLEAKVILNAYPDIKFRTRVLSVAPRATVRTTGEQAYRNVIEVRTEEPFSDDGAKRFRDMVDLRQGLEGKVAVECGQRSLFYVLTHEFVDFIRIAIF